MLSVESDVVEISMTCGLSFSVTREDFESEKTIVFPSGDSLTIVPARFRWMVMRTHTGYVYNRIDRPKGKRFTVYLHRLLCECPVGMYVNHIDFNTLNNSRDNLEIVTARENGLWKRRRVEAYRARGINCCLDLRSQRCAS